MNATHEVSIRTPFNRRDNPRRQDRRVLVNGRWKHVDPQANAVMRWLRGDSQMQRATI